MARSALGLCQVGLEVSDEIGDVECGIPGGDQIPIDDRDAIAVVEELPQVEVPMQPHDRAGLGLLVEAHGPLAKRADERFGRRPTRCEHVEPRPDELVHVVGEGLRRPGLAAQAMELGEGLPDSTHSRGERRSRDRRERLPDRWRHQEDPALPIPAQRQRGAQASTPGRCELGEDPIGAFRRYRYECLGDHAKLSAL
jgi:hypothetical protein